MNIDKEQVKIELSGLKAFPPECPALRELAEQYLADKLVEPMTESELKTLIEENGTWYMGEWLANPENIAEALVGKVGRQFVPASEEDIEKIIRNTKVDVETYREFGKKTKIFIMDLMDGYSQGLQNRVIGNIAKAIVNSVAKNVSEEDL